MALPSSGQITLDQMHVEAGGTTGTQAGLNDADIRDLISASSGSEMEFSDWYGASAFAYQATMLSGTQTYRGAITNVATPTSFPLTYLHSATLSDQTFDPLADQGIASTPSISTPGLINQLFSHSTDTRTFFRLNAVSEPSNSGWTSIRAQGTGGDTHDQTLNRADASFSYNASQDRLTYTWSTSYSRLIPDFATTYTITAQ